MSSDGEALRTDFKKMLLTRFQTIVRAWRHIDVNCDGRLSLFEFCRACRELGVSKSARAIFEAFDVNRCGFISLNELDAEIAYLLASLSVKIWTVCGSVTEAWKSCFNPRGRGRIMPEEFARGCSEVGFDNNIAAAYEALASDMATTGMSKQEFELLQIWLSRERPHPMSPLHEAAERELSSRLERTPQLPIVKVENKSAAPNKEQFKTLLLNVYGNFVRAWREGLDRDHNGLLDW